MLCFEHERFENCLFVSPVLDMKQLILKMMSWANVTEEQLCREKIIPTSFGQTLTWEYWQYAVNHPILKWDSPTRILYGEHDHMIDYRVAENFSKKFHCTMTVMTHGEHWFHTEQQINFLGLWISNNFQNSFPIRTLKYTILTFAINNSTIVNSKSGGVVMSSIDLVILGIVLEKPQSAYDIQKDVEYHHFSRWTKISVPSIYRKVLQMSEKGYLQSDIVKGGKFADKAIYSITDKGRVYFKELMAYYAAGPVPLLFDFNVVISNLNKMDKAEAMELVSALRQSIQSSAELNEGYAQEFADIPLVGRTIFEQQQLLYNALLEWLNHFEGQFLQE